MVYDLIQFCTLFFLKNKFMCMFIHALCDITTALSTINIVIYIDQEVLLSHQGIPNHVPIVFDCG